jgi:hypothetical protein
MPTPERKTDPEKLDEEARRAALDEHIAELVARAPEMTSEQAARIRRLFRYGPVG